MKTVFLDRDGTIIVDPPDLRVDKVEKIQLFPDSIEALRYLAEHDFNVVIITNQAGIAEGRINEEEFWTIHNKALEMLSPSGVKVLKTYMSPHGSDAVTEWRKPGPGMLLQAAKDFELNLSDIYMVGDNHSDIMAGMNAGTKTVLVKTANENVEAPEATYTAPNLLDAVKYIVNHS
jgi:histidinol-phosphate phosphatase family protein